MRRMKGFENRYIIDDNIVKIYVFDKNKIEYEAQIDLGDLQKLIDLNYYWRICTYNQYLHYVVSYQNYNKELHKNEKIFLSNIIAGISNKDFHADHIDHNTLNNRKNNLRIDKTSNNLKNRKSKNSNNTSGYRNVSWNKSINKWVVQLQVNGKNTILGKFDDVHEAGKFAKKMRIKYYGDYAGNE